MKTYWELATEIVGKGRRHSTKTVAHYYNLKDALVGLAEIEEPTAFIELCGADNSDGIDFGQRLTKASLPLVLRAHLRLDQ